MSDAVIRRNVDARIVSYALAVLQEQPVAPELQATFQGCAAAALQAASGLVALVVACKAAASSPLLARCLDGQQQARVSVLLEALGNYTEQAWGTEIKEMLEVIVVLAAESAPTFEEEARVRQWAQAVVLDTRGLKIFEEKVQADVEIEDQPEPKRDRNRKARDSKQAYQHERLENLVSRSVTMGVDEVRAQLLENQIVIVGTGVAKKQVRLVKIRGTMQDAVALCKAANVELQALRVGEIKRD